MSSIAYKVAPSCTWAAKQRAKLTLNSLPDKPSLQDRKCGNDILFTSVQEVWKPIFLTFSDQKWASLPSLGRRRDVVTCVRWAMWRKKLAQGKLRVFQSRGSCPGPTAHACPLFQIFFFFFPFTLNVILYGSTSRPELTNIVTVYKREANRWLMLRTSWHWDWC